MVKRKKLFNELSSVLRTNGTFDLALWVQTATCCKRQNVDKFHDNDIQPLISKFQLLLWFFTSHRKTTIFLFTLFQL